MWCACSGVDDGWCVWCVMAVSGRMEWRMETDNDQKKSRKRKQPRKTISYQRDSRTQSTNRLMALLCCFLVFLLCCCMAMVRVEVPIGARKYHCENRRINPTITHTGRYRTSIPNRQRPTSPHHVCTCRRRRRRRRFASPHTEAHTRPTRHIIAPGQHNTEKHQHTKHDYRRANHSSNRMSNESGPCPFVVGVLFDVVDRVCVDFHLASTLLTPHARILFHSPPSSMPTVSRLPLPSFVLPSVVPTWLSYSVQV